MTNYFVKSGDYSPLSDIMGQDYDTEKKYKIHINKCSENVLQVLYTTGTPTNKERGIEYPEFAEIEIKADTGDDVYLRASNKAISVDISEVVVGA